MNPKMYILLTLVLFLVELGYIKFARYFAIIDLPNERSSHKNATIRGGGIIFILAAGIYFFFSNYQYQYFFFGLTIISIVSFWDDKYTLSSKRRIIFQFFSIFVAYGQVYQTFFWPLLPMSILIVGMLNAYNFMDGINGMTGGYSLVMLFCFSFINHNIIHFIDTNLVNTIIASVFVFLFFNFRKKAICFSGDVGSIGIAFILTFLTFLLIIKTSDWKYLFFFTLYGIDTIYTLIFRISRKENIFKAHKLHLFQLLVNDFKNSHLQISIYYSLVQLLLNIWIVYQSLEKIMFYLPFIVITFIYHMLRKTKNLHITI